jgi:GT2 family glycosyltransferase
VTAPRCTVVIPSHDRPASLEAVVSALAAQTVPPEQFEVVVVLDGPSPASVAMMTALRDAGRLPQLRWLEQPRQGQAAARNAGAAEAGARVLVFLDDDVVPEPDLVATHLAHHEAGEPIAVLGDSRFVRKRGSYYHLLSWAWWEDLFSERTRPGRPAALHDFCAGNVSARREDFQASGGFDPAFTGYGGEDYELGYRLLQRGVRFVPDRRARAAHHHEATIAAVLRKTRQEAHGDLVLVTKHPELHRTVRMSAPLRGPVVAVARLALQAPWLGDPLVAAGARVLVWLEAASHRHPWLRGFKALRTYAYWRGVRDALGSWDALQRFRAAAPPRVALTIDVSDGLPEALPPIPAAGADVAITAHGRTLGTVVLTGAPRESPRRELAREALEQLGPAVAGVLGPGDRPWWLVPETLARG